ncbi:MAG: threonine/serine exporter family protein [Lachnospiraceae bacterium]|nr:threonine/serine exporter family protein [Lachnospiraceae bacterium]
MDHINERELLHCLMDLGEVMVKSGAETNRVEDTLNRMGKAYGAVRMDVFAITSSMVVSMQMEDGKEWTLTRRIRKPAVMDFTRLECCNALSRRCCSEVMDLDTLSEEIQKIRDMKVSAWTDYFGSIVVAGAFCMFFGGTLQDALVAVAFAVIICLFQSKLERFCPTRVVFNFLAALLTGIGICYICRWIPVLHTDKIIIGDIMLLIPGVVVSTACTDVMAGDTIAGSMRLIEAVIWAGALACGYMLSLILVGGWTVNGSNGVLLQLFTALVGTFGYCFLVHLRKCYIPAAAIGGLLVWAVYLLGMDSNLGVFWSALFAALCGGIYGDVMARVYKTPSTIFFIPAIIPLVPGSNLYYTLFYTVYKDIAMARENAFKTIMFSLAIAVGISAVATWLHMWRACRGRSQGAWGR